MELEKKDYAIIILGVILLFSLLNNGVVVHHHNHPSPNLGIVLIYGTMEGPADLDPMDAWDTASFEVHDQVCEGLYGYNYTDPDMNIIPILAKEFGTWNLTGPKPIYTVELRDDVWFHDGTKFDATSVKWNFDRLLYLMNHSLAKASKLFEYYDPNTQSSRYIINHTEIIDSYKIKFICNTPYGPIESLLCSNGAYILSPSSTPFDNVIDTCCGNLVGTGPFVYYGYEAGVEVRFSAWDFYYRPRARIDTLIYSVINDNQIRNNALLSRDIDILLTPLSSMLGSFENDSDILIHEQKSNTNIQYLRFNTKYVNQSFRQALSYAINYTHIIENLKQGRAKRMESLFPEHVNFFNNSFNIATYNITKARIIMQNMGFGTELAIDDNSGWRNQALTNPFGRFNISRPYFGQDTFYLELFSQLLDNFKDIGILVEDKVPGGTYIGCPPPWWWDSEIYWNSYKFASKDPNISIDELFNNETIIFDACFGYHIIEPHYNGYLDAIQANRNPFNYWDNVQLLLEISPLEINQTIRKGYYDRIQQLLVEEDMPIALGLTEFDYDIWQSNLKGFPSNPMGKAYFYPCFWEDLFKSKVYL